MSQNDVLALNANFEDWVKRRGAGLSGVQPFLYYSLEQILKPFNLVDEDIRYGITDHANDGGIDAIYFLANRNTLIRDDLDIATSGTAKVRLLIFQVKSSLNETGFKPVDIDKFANFTDDLLDLGRDVKTFAHKYHAHLLTLMRTFKDKYLQIAGNFPEVSVDYYYVTRGDETHMDANAEDAIKRLEGIVHRHFGTASLIGESSFAFYTVNTQKLSEFVKKRRQRIRKLRWSGHPPLPIGDSYVGLVKLSEYHRFLMDEDSGELDELIFESNVRGYQRNTTVNRQIRETLASEGDVDFWLLNNGVTIISGGKLQPIDAMQVSIEDPQVVNGLQTSREIFKYFQEAKPVNEQRDVLVKVIRATSEEVQDKITRATNSQNPMQASSLRGTDTIHRQIEALFKQYGFYYDRRPGYYKDQGMAIQAIVGLTELVQAVVSIIHRRPNDARARPGDYIREGRRGDKLYASIFGVDTDGKTALPLGVYLKCINIMREVDAFLEKRQVDPGDQRNIRFYIACHACSEMTKKEFPSPDEILKIDPVLMTEGQIAKSHDVVWARYQRLAEGSNVDSVAKGLDLAAQVAADITSKYYDPNAKPSTAPKNKPQKVRDILQLGEVN